MTSTIVQKPAPRDSLPVRNPRTGEIDMQIAPASAEEIAAICARLRQAQEPWGRAPIAHRIELMKKWAESLQAQKEALIEADSIDTGGGQISTVAPDMVIGSIRRTCAMAPAIFEQARRSGTAPGTPHIKYDTNLRPYPLAGIIGPWNAPLMLSTLHAIPALFAGCAVIVKPSEMAPRFVKPMMETIRGIPELANVLTYVVGDGKTGKRSSKTPTSSILPGASRTADEWRRPARGGSFRRFWSWAEKIR